MWTGKAKAWYVLYKIFAAWLPESRHMRAAKAFRRLLAKYIIRDIGDNVNIERKASFTPEIKIGNNSGIGIACEINGPVYIGNDVMMGPGSCNLYKQS